MAENSKQTMNDTYETTGIPLLKDSKLSVRNVDVFYGDKQAIFDVNLDIGKNQVHEGQPLELGLDKWTHEYYGNKEFLLNSIEYLSHK